MNTIFGKSGCRAEDGVPDMTVLSDIDEAAINTNLRMRYSKDLIYTYSGTILVAVNPYKELEIYNQECVWRYQGKKLMEEEPHVFALAESSLRALQNSEKNQSCVISGESGAGKTETTKFLLQYLCSVTTGVSTWVEQQILEANSILEAFGNAKTVRNDNSSRFGKFMQVCFDQRWHIKGCVMQDYLLEQSRITFQGPSERNYHVFYQLVAAAQQNEELRNQFHLLPADSYEYLNQSGCSTIEGVDDAVRFDALRLAFSVLHIPAETCDGIFRTLSAILWLGNLKFSDLDGEKCELCEEDLEVISKIAGLLSISCELLKETVLQRQINIRGNVTHIPFKLDEAKENRHAMAKALYSRTFAWLVDHINKCTNPGQDQTRFLGVLDIFGFENFAVNSFEQLCINYTNEKLHKFFNHYVFALEQETYRQEEIKFTHVTFTDNSECLELLEKPPRCILKLISEECRMPKGSDKSYLVKLHNEFESHPNYIKGDDRRNWEVEFGISHYAGSVIYTVSGFVDKNRDAQQDVFFDLMTKSENGFVADLTRFQDLLGCTIARMGSVPSTISRGSTKGKPTVSDAFRNQLQALVDVLQASNPWYVRCIKPNHNKLPDCYDVDLVLDQLKYLGMNDIIRIRREGYPIHLSFDEFVRRYFCLWHRRRFKCAKTHASELIGEQKMSRKDWQVGKSKVFMRQKVFELLEERRQTIVSSAAVRLQKDIRMFCKRRDFLRKKNAVVVIQSWYRSSRTRREFVKRRRAVIIIQAFVRGMFAREVANALREMKRLEEEEKKRERLEEERRLREEQMKEDELESAESSSPPRVVDNEQFEKELETLTDVLQSVNPKMVSTNVNNDKNSDSGPTEAEVDLDSIFDFLSKVQHEKHPLDETLDDMDHLLEEVDEEINALNEKNKQSNENSSSAPVVEGEKVEEATYTNGVREPTPPAPPTPPESPPLPPPPVHNGDDFPPPPEWRHSPELPPPCLEKPVQPKEPIYETIPLAKNSLQPSREPSYVSGPPPEGPPPAPPQDQEGRGLPQSLPRPPPAPPQDQERRGLPQSLPGPPPAPPQDQERRGLPQSLPGQSLNEGRHTPTSTYESHVRGGRGHWDDQARLASEKRRDDLRRAERRKLRVEKKLNELEDLEAKKQKAEEETDLHFDLIEFAELYFNSHEKASEGSLMSTLKKRSPSSSSIEYLPKYELVTYSKSTSIPTSHIRLNDPENVNIACNIYRDICKYSRGETKLEQETALVQSMIENGIEREELRNEIFVQCMRQATNNPNAEAQEKIWLILCLCVVAFQPSKVLYKYFYNFLQKSLNLDGKLSQYAQWCIENCRNNKGTSRKLPPSQVEIAAMKKLGTIVCRLFFMDGRTKAIDVHPRDTAGDAIGKLSERLGLANVDGWAIYVVGADGEKHVKSHEYLYDIISSWEKKQSKGTSGSLGRKSSSSGLQGTPSGENRFVFRRRLFRNPREIPSDPVEVNLLYAQAVHSVVRADDYPINEKVALQLAGLQAQVSLGDPQMGKTEFYSDVHSYLPPRIAHSQKMIDWVPVLAKAHQQYGTGKTDILAKVWYLTCVMQFPLYGTTMFRVSYRGYWSHGNSLILGVNSEGISMIKPDDKAILCEYRFCEIESIFLDPSDNFITINLLRTLPDTHKCFVFETKEKEEIGFLIASYSPALATWIKEAESGRKAKHITSEDRVRLYYNIVHSRRQMIDNDLLRKPIDQGPNFIVSTLRKLNKQKLDRLRQDFGETAETYKGYHHTFWAFSKVPLIQTILKIEDREIEEQALQISQVIFAYSGLNPNSEIRITSDDQQLVVIQSLLEQCMKQNLLLNESYLQLVKQTNEHPDANSRVNLRHWSLLTLFCSVIPPTDKLIRKYLRAHLQRCSIDYITEEGKYARYAERCLLKALNNRRRQWPPSRQEILCTMNRRPIYARFHFMDGQFHSVEFDASANASDVVDVIKQKVGLKESAKGYAIYEMLGTTERCVGKEEVLADVMSRWERYRQATAAANTGAPHSHHIFLFKKHLLLESWIDLSDTVEKELLYFQVLYSLRADKFPVTHTEAVMLCALRAQIELGNYLGMGMDYTEVIEHTLSPRLLTAVTHDAVAMQHQSLFNMDPQEAKESFLTLIKSFPLHRATIFDVTQSFTSNWPKVLWLALDECGVHLLEHRSRNVLCTYEYNYILNYSASLTALMIITGSKRKQSKVILNTTQAFMILTLIKDYSEVVLNQPPSKDRNGIPDHPYGNLIGLPTQYYDGKVNGLSATPGNGEGAVTTPKSTPTQTLRLRKMSDRSMTTTLRPLALVEEVASK